jgi:hypothetical protein
VLIEFKCQAFVDATVTLLRHRRAQNQPGRIACRERPTLARATGFR